MEYSKLINSPKHTIVERVALAMSCEFYEIARSSGDLDVSAYPNYKVYARKNFLKFIPYALDALIPMMGRNDIAEYVKEEIYEAIQERINDPRMTMGFDNKLPDFDVTKLLDKTPPAPVIVNNKKFDPDKERLNNLKGLD